MLSLKIQKSGPIPSPHKVVSSELLYWGEDSGRGKEQYLIKEPIITPTLLVWLGVSPLPLHPLLPWESLSQTD